MLEVRRRKSDKAAGGVVTYAGHFVNEVEKGLVLAVIEFRNDHRTADGTAIVRQLEGIARPPDGIEVEAVGSQNVVLSVIVGRAMQLVGAGLQGEVSHCRLSTAVLRAHRSGLQLELADGLSGRRHFVI